MTVKKLAYQEVMAFEVWMRDIVKTMHYADNKRMADAYDRVFSNSLEIIIGKTKNKK